MQCFSWLVLLVVTVFVMISLLRWFEQTSEAVERRAWDRVLWLTLFPFAVWFYPSKVSAGRPTAVPRHVPARGFGPLPKEAPAAGDAPAPGKPPPDKTRLPGVTDEPPPGTPREFLGMPVVPPRARQAKAAVDPDKLARLRRKMIEQGMLKEEPGDEPPPPRD